MPDVNVIKFYYVFPPADTEILLRFVQHRSEIRTLADIGMVVGREINAKTNLNHGRLVTDQEKLM